MQRMTFTPDIWGYTPLWSPDGASLAFSTCCGPNGHQIHTRLADGSGAETVLTDAGAQPRLLSDWSGDGGEILFSAWQQGISSISVDGGEASRLVDAAGFYASGGRLAPDGDWLAFGSNESGADEVCLQSLSGGGKILVSTDGGVSPRWASDGAELFYVAGDQTLRAVPVERQEVGLPHTLFQLPAGVRGNAARASYSTVDGERFLLRVVDGESLSSLAWVHNWAAEQGPSE